MKRATPRRSITFVTTIIALALLLAVPVHAAPKKSKLPGDINPTSVPVVDDDFTDAVKVVSLTPLEETKEVDVTLVSLESKTVVVGDSEATSLASSDAVPVTTANDPVDYLDAVLREQIGADAANRIATGRGTVVAVLDAGFDTSHPLLAGRIAKGGYDFVDWDDDPNDRGNGIDDDFDGVTDRGVGHGTMVAAMVLNAAPDAMILPMRVRDDEGRGTDKAVVYAIMAAAEAGVDVINLSIEMDTWYEDDVFQVAEKARALGIVIVASAGNDGQPHVPWTTWTVAHLSVGAVDAADVIAPFSNYYTKGLDHGWMVFAPGVDLLGPMVVDGIYTRGHWSGTSFSAGVVSGAVAVLRQLHPEWDGYAIAEAVAASVEPVYLPTGKVVRKVGRVSLGKVVTR